MALSTATAASDAASINFCAIGDWGGMEWFPYFTYAQYETAKGMGKVAEDIQSQFVLALGDNFYHTGVNNDHSYRFKRTFEDVYKADSLQTPWYAIGGNHDHYGNITAQIAHSLESPNGRWVFPSLYHSHSFSAPDDSFTIDLILIDTVDLCGNNEIQEESKAGYFDPLPLKDKSDAREQWKWIEAKMKASTADYLLVGGHFPVYSACSHGPTETLIRHLKPLLQQYNAHYLSGHDHCMMHYEEEGVHFVLSGMGDECCYEAPNNRNKDSHFALNPEPGSLKWLISKENKDLYEAIGGFTSFQTTANEMKIQYHDHRGNVIFTADPVPPRTKDLRHQEGTQDTPLLRKEVV